MQAVFRHELKSHFRTLTGYLFCAFLLLFVGIYTMALCLTQGSARFDYVLGNAVFAFFIIVPVITMRTISEERRQKTDQLLYSLPLSTTEVVLGKYFALLCILALPLLIMCIYPLILSGFGRVPLKQAYGAIIAFFFLGAAFLAIGLFISSVTENLMLAAGLSFIVLLLNYFLTALAGIISTAPYVSLIAFLVIGVLLTVVVFLMTKNVFASVVTGILLIGGTAVFYSMNSAAFSGLFPDVLKQFSLFNRYYNFMADAFPLKDIVFFLSVTAIFVFLSVQSMEKRRWS